MGEWEEKLSQVINDPGMMQKLISMANALGNSGTQHDAPPPEKPTPDIDMELVKKISRMVSQSGIDQNQKQLLSALTPYLQPRRVQKLEKAMRAAKMASLATSLLGR